MRFLGRKQQKKFRGSLGLQPIRAINRFFYADLSIRICECPAEIQFMQRLPSPVRIGH